MSGKKIAVLIVSLAFCLDFSDGKIGNRPHTSELAIEPVHQNDAGYGHHLDLGGAPVPASPSCGWTFHWFVSILKVHPHSIPTEFYFCFHHSAGGLPLY